MNWPRAPLLVTMSLYNLRIRLRERTARWQFCFLPRLTNLSNSGRTYEQRNWCRNLSAPLFLVRLQCRPPVCHKYTGLFEKDDFGIALRGLCHACIGGYEGRVSGLGE